MKIPRTAVFRTSRRWNSWLSTPWPGRPRIVRLRGARRISIHGWQWLPAISNRASAAAEKLHGCVVYVVTEPATGATFGHTESATRAGAAWNAQIEMRFRRRRDVLGAIRRCIAGIDTNPRRRPAKWRYRVR